MNSVTCKDALFVISLTGLPAISKMAPSSIIRNVVSFEMARVGSNLTLSRSSPATVIVMI